MAAILELDVCTPEGKTWLARITGVGGRYGVDRDFVNSVSKDLSKSGKTGTFTYVLDTDGIYQSNEGRKRLGRRWWRVTGDSVEEIDERVALAEAAGGAS
jgi:hypothetical protein